MKTFIKYILILLFLLAADILSFATAINWTDNTSNKTRSVSIPSTLNWNFPTNDTYEIGYFVYLTGTYSCVGKATVVPGQSLLINLGVYNGTTYGYNPGDRFITLIRNTNDTSKEYALEFSYGNDKNTR